MNAVNYLWNPLNDNIVEEFDDAGNTVAEYTTEPEQFGNVVSQYRDSQESFFHFDELGSILVITDVGGNITDTRSYSAFGETTEQSGSTVCSFSFVGQKEYVLDSEDGAVLVRRRTYALKRGQWMSKDPAPIEYGKMPYIYADSNPATWIDASGESIKPPKGGSLPRFPTFATTSYWCEAGVWYCWGSCTCSWFGTNAGLKLAMLAQMQACCQFSCACQAFGTNRQPLAMVDCVEIGLRFSGPISGPINCICT